MPTNDAQWLWFIFYTGGALLAWAWFLAVAVEMAGMLWERRTRRKSDGE